MKQHPTKEQWQQVAKQLDSLFGQVYLRCDGYLVYAVMTRTGKNKLAILVYVDGVIIGKWMTVSGAQCEEPRRFWRPQEQLKYGRKFVADMEKLIGKRRCQAKGYYDKLRYYTPEWNRPLPFIRHLQKHNERIEIIDSLTYRNELQARKAAHVQETVTDAAA